MEYIIYLIAASLVLVVFAVASAGKKIGSLTVLNFGPARPATKPVELYTYQLKKYSRQQSWAFALLWIAVFFSLLMGLWLLYNKVIVDGGDTGWLTQAIGLASGSGVSVTAFTLYRTASNKVEELINKIKG